MNLSPLFIYGSGGHGRVVAEAAVLSGQAVEAFISDGEEGEVKLFDGPHPIFSKLPDQPAQVIVAVGDNATRLHLLTTVLDAGWALANVIHPSAVLSPSAELGRGVFVGPKAIVHTGAVLRDGVIVNSGVIVDHDGDIGCCVHLGPGSVLTGNVTIGAETLIGAGATIIPECRIGARCVVGAGAVVINDLPDGTKAVGVPARQAT